MIAEAELVSVLQDSKTLTDQGMLVDPNVRAVAFTWKEEPENDAITLHWLVRDEVVSGLLSEVDSDFEPWWIEETYHYAVGKCDKMQYLMKEDVGRHLLAMEGDALLVHLWQRGYLVVNHG